MRADVVVIGGGPAGIAAASCAAEQGRTVHVIDEGVGPGGQIWRPSIVRAHTGVAAKWIARLERSGATIHRGTTVVDARRTDSAFVVLAQTRDAPFELEAASLVIATGARERFLPFPGWTLPNVIGAGGAQALLKSGRSFHGKRVVIAGSGPLLMAVGASLARAGADVRLVAEQAASRAVYGYAAGLWRHPSRLLQAANYRRAFVTTRYAVGTWVASAHGSSQLESVVVTDGRSTRTIPCDVLCIGYGLVPSTELARLLGCTVREGTVVVDDAQMTSVPAVFCAGEPTGIGGVDLAVVEGEIAGLAATEPAAARAMDARLLRVRAALRRDAEPLNRAFALRPEVLALARDDTIVCRCEDVRLGALDRTWSARQAKLYTRAGMGPCQGRVCGAALESLMGWTPDTVRPPLHAARVDTLLASHAEA